MRVSGQRNYPRFQIFGAWTGQLRSLRQVEVTGSHTGQTLYVISDVPGVVGEELTLGLAQGSEHVDVQVRVVATSPRVISHRVRHQLQLEVLEIERASVDSGGPQR